MSYIYCLIYDHDFGESYEPEEAVVTESYEWVEKNGVNIITSRRPIKLFEAKCKRKCKNCSYEANFRANWDDQNLMPTYTFSSWVGSE